MTASVATYLWGIFFCVLGSSFFSMTETSLTALSPVEVERLAASKNWWKRSLKAWVAMPNRLLASILLGNTLVSVAAASFATSMVNNYFPNVRDAIVIAVLTVIILIFGEIAPKMIARSYPERVAPVACRILIPINFIFQFITQTIARGIVLILRPFGIIVASKRRINSDDIEAMVTMARREGSMESSKSKILSSVFQFSKRRVKDIMIPKDDISAVSVDASLVEILDLVRQENHSRYPVYKGNLDRIIGFLHARDLFGVLRTYGFGGDHKPALSNFSLRTCLRRAFFVPEQAMISNVLNEMKKKRIHLAIVKDEWGNVVGLVTLEDILEEVFGEIEDEHDEHSEKPLIDLLEVGLEVDGDISISDLQSKFDLDIETSESYSTLNGFLLHYAGHQQLTEKTVIIWKNYVFAILSIKEGEIERVRITQIPDDEKA